MHAMHAAEKGWCHPEVIGSKAELQVTSEDARPLPLDYPPPTIDRQTARICGTLGWQSNGTFSVRKTLTSRITL